jgi:phage repressor protein C with HTH and peptisase S24 domain
LVITDWIDACKRELGIKSDRQFSRLTGISSGLLSKWRNGECTPSTDSLKKIAAATGKDFSILIGYAAGISDSVKGPASDIDPEHRRSDGGNLEINNDRTRYIRVFKSEEIRNDEFICGKRSGSSSVSDSEASCSNGPEFSVPDEYDYIVLPDIYEHQDEYFAFSVPDNNMAPELYSGDTVIVHRQDDASEGDTVIACIRQDCAVCAILLHIDEGIILNSPTRNPGPAFFSNSAIRDLPVTIIGKVVDIYHRNYK